MTAFDAQRRQQLLEVLEQWLDEAAEAEPPQD